MADGSIHTPTNLFTALAKPKFFANLGKVANHQTFSRPILSGNKGITIQSMAIKVASSPIIIPQLFKHFQSAVLQMAKDHATDPRFMYADSRATMYISQEYLEPGETNLFGGYHVDAFNTSAAINGNEPITNIYLVSNVEYLTARFYTLPVVLSDNEQNEIRNARTSHQNNLLNSALERKLYNAPFIQSRPLHLYRFGIYDPHSVPDADVPTWRTVLSVHFETDTPIASVKARAKARPFLFKHNPDLADWIRQHAARPQDYGL